MSEIHWLAKALIVSGLVMILIGGLFLFRPFSFHLAWCPKGRDLLTYMPWIGKLPGDIYLHKKGFRFYFPVTTCVLISVIISLVLWFLGRR